jgi:hypothetical protein
MQDKKLARLGDAYINLVYSLALTESQGQPQGVKVSDRVLAEAFKSAGLRSYLGTGHSRKDFANASEAILIDAYRKGMLTLNESVKVIIHGGNFTAGIAELLKLSVERLTQL